MSTQQPSRTAGAKQGFYQIDSSLSSANQPSIPVSSLLHNLSSQMDPIAHAERQVEAALDDLVAMGALQKKNQMDIESLLNPDSESHILTETSDVKIYQVVIDAIEARENIKITGGDDVDNDIPLDPRPTYRDVLKAVSTIHRYIDDLNDPIAHKMEALLASFNMKLCLNESRSMKGTVLTDYCKR
ncbi:hypothetical protein L208DRAFT_1555854, partial [Tricholoma matsutake]